jgi:transcriptional regulator PpsR
MKQFESPEVFFGGLDAGATGRVVAATADLTLLIDRQGIVRDLAITSEELGRLGLDRWLNRAWIDTVTPENRHKVEALLQRAATQDATPLREITHLAEDGTQLPLLYSTVALRAEGPILASGRDLRPLAHLQQRLVEAQLSLERDYSRLRHAEMRYRLLFQIASEAVLIVDAISMKVLEANPAAVQLLGGVGSTAVGTTFPTGFDARGNEALLDLLAAARAGGRRDDARVRLTDGSREFLVSASIFRQELSQAFLVRFTPVRPDALGAVVSKPKSKLIELIENSPDGFVVTDPAGAILTSNRAFLDLAQLVSEDFARGESLSRWLGRAGSDFPLMLANLRQHGSLRLFSSALRGEHGALADVEVSAVAVLEGGTPCLGFTIRHVGRRIEPPANMRRKLPRSVEQMTELVGKVPLKDLVRETTDVIERMCIEAALELAQDNRASAAEMLGLSRQSLYVKLRRYGLSELDSEHEVEDRPEVQ